MSITVLQGDVLARLNDLAPGSVNCCVTSPPYWGLRDYGVSGQIGLEPTPDDYVARMVEVFREVRRVLRDDGTLWLNLGDTYNNCDKWGGGGANTGKHTRTPNGDVASWQAVRRRWDKIEGLKPKDLIGIPWRVALALQADGWYLRSDIIWHKPNVMPESVKDRPTKAHEYVFLLTKSDKYYYDAEAVKEPFQTDPKENYPKRSKILGHGKQEASVACLGQPQQDKSGGFPPSGEGRNRRSVWVVTTNPYKGAHFATFPEALVEPCILAGAPEGGTVLDPFVGSGTTLAVAERLGRNSIGIELNPAYIPLIEQRIAPYEAIKELR